MCSIGLRILLSDHITYSISLHSSITSTKTTHWSLGFDADRLGPKLFFTLGISVDAIHIFGGPLEGGLRGVIRDRSYSYPGPGASIWRRQYAFPPAAHQLWRSCDGRVLGITGPCRFCSVHTCSSVENNNQGFELCSYGSACLDTFC